jgi:hypothetical protein
LWSSTDQTSVSSQTPNRLLAKKKFRSGMLSDQAFMSSTNKITAIIFSKSFIIPLPRQTMNNVFPSTHPLVAHKLALLRRADINPRQFRELVREIAALLTYEATADLSTKAISVETPLATEISAWCRS